MCNKFFKPVITIAFVMSVFIANAQTYNFKKESINEYSLGSDSLELIRKVDVVLTVKIDTAKNTIQFNNHHILTIEELGKGRELGIDTYYCKSRTGNNITIQTWMENGRRILTIYGGGMLTVYE